jgi:hypothetical protein
VLSSVIDCYQSFSSESNTERLVDGGMNRSPNCEKLRRIGEGELRNRGKFRVRWKDALFKRVDHVPGIATLLVSFIDCRCYRVFFTIMAFSKREWFHMFSRGSPLPRIFVNSTKNQAKINMGLMGESTQNRRKNQNLRSPSRRVANPSYFLVMWHSMVEGLWSMCEAGEIRCPYSRSITFNRI